MLLFLSEYFGFVCYNSTALLILFNIPSISSYLIFSFKYSLKILYISKSLLSTLSLLFMYKTSLSLVCFHLLIILSNFLTPSKCNIFLSINYFLKF